MSHRSKYHNILVRNVCRHNCFSKYHSDGSAIGSGCDKGGCALVTGLGCDRGGCGHSDPLETDHDVLKQTPVKLEDLPQVLSELKGKNVWLFCLDFFDERNFDIWSALPDQDETLITVEGCVRSFWRNYESHIFLLTQKNIKEVWFGVESANRELRKSYNKPDFENFQLEIICRKLKAAGIKYNFYMVTGPEDNRETVRENNELIRKCGPEIAWYSLLVSNKKYRRHFTQTNC